MERLSFFGMNAILVLYLTASPLAQGMPGPGLGLDTAAAAAVAGSYGALVFLTPLMGGWAADRLLGSSLAVLAGGVVITTGHALMALPRTSSFWMGLLAIALGTGLLKPNVTALVGATQPDDQARRDAAFSLFYMCTNIGAFLAPLFIGSLAQARGWHWGFAAAGLAMAVALLVFVLASGGSEIWRRRPLQPLLAAEMSRLRRRVTTIAAGIGLLVLIHGWLRGFSPEGLALDLLVLVLSMALLQLFQLWRTPGLPLEQRRGVQGFVVVFAATVAFFVIYTQAGSVMIAFAQQHLDRHLGGWELPTSWLMAVNPLGVILFAPVFASLWLRLGVRAPNPALKFAIAFLILAVSLILMVPSGFKADAGLQPGVLWLVILIVLQTWAELLLMPVAMSAVSHLAPMGLESRMLATWYLSISVGAAVGGQLFTLLGRWGLGPFFGLLAVLISSCAVIMLSYQTRLKPLLS